ncbi:MAG: hypothetical protein HUU16_18645, partial [Candidatus Omnitrophica bacterium]|nr:hypothetical protein [Candidatus Omnitrophota bacterium]
FAQAIFSDVDADPGVVEGQIAVDFFGNRTGRWGGIYFSDSDVGGSSATASRIQFARVEFAEVGIYAQDRTLDRNLVRDENALRIVSSILERNLIGLSIDGFSPVVANNIIRYSKRDPSFDARSFNNTTPRTTACNLTSAQRFPVGASGAGVFVTKRRSSSSVATDPLFFQNQITDNELVGAQVQQNGVAVSYGTPTTFNRPKPRFGRAVAPIDSAHEFQNVGQNQFTNNGPSMLAALNVIYNVRESPADNGVGSLDHPADMPAQNNDWGTPDPNEINQSIRDGLDEFNDLGEVIFGPFLTPAPVPRPPLANRIPDIRHTVAPAGDAFATLDLDDYALDADSRDPVTGAQDPLTWTETGSNTSILAPFNTLEVTVPVSASPSGQNVNLTVENGNPPNPVNVIRVHTSNILLGDPLVDTQIGKGDGSSIPHGWCLKGGANGTGPISIAQPQSGAGGGVLQLTLTSGLGVTPLFRDDSLISSSGELANPLAPSGSNIALKGHALGAPGPGPVNLTAVNLQVDADLNGVTVTPQAAFSDWVRLSVTRKLADGSDDSYSLAIADLLLGQTTNLVGNAFGAAAIIGATENHAFENINLTQFLGAVSSTAMNSLTPANRRAAVISQQTSWSVLAVGMGTDGTFSGGGNYPEMDITATGKPAATYPGATSGNALRVTFNKSGLQGVFLGHKGIPNTAYNEGDVLTLSLNSYVDLAYNGVADELINEPTAGLALAFTLFTLPGSAAQSINYVFFPPAQSLVAPLRKGVAAGTPYGRGGSQMVNPLALIHGKWTRHEVSLRIPQIGQNYQGPVGSGNVVDSLGVEGLIMLSRIDAPAGLPDQSVWLDNICISRCPGSLALAQGAINVPMVSAGFSLPFTNGANAGPGSFFTGPNGFGSDIAMPVALNRGQTIFGGFTQGGSGASQPVTPVAASTFWGTAGNAGKTGMLDLAFAGFLRGPAQGGVGAPAFDSAVVAGGGVDVALNFPTLPDGNRGLVVGPAPSSIGVNAFSSNITSGIPATGYNGEAVVNTPYLDMRAASDSLLPGLREQDVTFAGGSGGNPDGENGNLNPNQVLSNIAGVFGVRWFTRSNAAEVSHNPVLNVLLTNADFVLGLQATRNPSALPTGADIIAPDGVWVDDFISGSFITFNSFQKYYDIVLNNQTGGLAGITGEVPAALLADLAATNPGAQLAQVSIFKNNGYSFGITVRDIINNTNLKGFSGIFAPGLDGPVTLTDSLPGRYGTACLSIDEINLYGVRDSSAFYDEDLQRSDLLP